MTKPALIDTGLVDLLRKASQPMTAESRERQMVSLAYGNGKLENDRITRPLIEQVIRSGMPNK